MRPRWLNWVLSLSLTVNAGMLGYLAWLRYQTWKNEERLCRTDLRDRKSLVRFRELDAEWWRTLQPLNRERWDALRQLGELGEQPKPDSTQVESVLDRIQANDKARAEFAFRQDVALRAVIRPERTETDGQTTLRFLDQGIAQRESIAAQTSRTPRPVPQAPSPNVKKGGNQTSRDKHRNRSRSPQ